MAFPTVDEQSVAAKLFAGALPDQFQALAFAKETGIESVVFAYTNDTGGALAVGTVIEIGPVKNVKIMPSSRLITSAFGAGATLDLGLQAHVDNDGDAVAADQDTLVDDADVSAAYDAEFRTETTDTTPTGLRVEGQTTILATIGGAVMPANATITLMLELVPYKG